MNEERDKIIKELADIIEELQVLEHFYKLNDAEVTQTAVEIMKLDIMKKIDSKLHGIEKTLEYI